MAPRLRAFEPDTATKNCKQRDKWLCMVTQGDIPLESAHIFPPSLEKWHKNYTHSEDFWCTLRMFWSSERVDSWQRATIGGTERCSNLISLTSHVRNLWDMAVFGLRPVKMSSDQKSLTVQFYWLQPSSYCPRISMKSRPKFPADLQDAPENARICDCGTAKPVSSGDTMTFQTDDTDKHPLPSPELLDMQWVLHRLLALSGARDHPGTHLL
ncbi:hypothetical protein BO78DRAFT_362408 [Aspergillus sclerotiicarbonarius CBS 121057]|uniref:HNH nuclease domain-containing protein n=1 Tax=Aspergillus sclerotiicarbonarius (strain CBS 121057 / IBT 28362) TaxID=1448318 RepID=A0A319EQF8_ASPSB|nr:hypothetical protein BO78DRAFT_362408 [Aspergillus sclerotiicarbonarius CBS 121057]